MASSEKGYQCYKKGSSRDFPGGSVARLHTPSTGTLGSIPGQGTKSQILQLRLGTAK